MDNSEKSSGSNPAFPIEAYNAAAARPPVNSLLFILPAFEFHAGALRSREKCFGDYCGQHMVFVKSCERGFWQSISKDPVAAVYRLEGDTIQR
jgi:hypothetical protein